MMKKKKKIHKHTFWKILKREQMSSQRLLVNFTKEDKINFNCAILFNTNIYVMHFIVPHWKWRK
jgi:hypothetical protein